MFKHLLGVCDRYNATQVQTLRMSVTGKSRHSRLAEEAETLEDLLSNLKCHIGRIHSSVFHVDMIKLVSARPQWHGASVNVHVYKQSECQKGV